jgi:hypothetical protein
LLEFKDQCVNNKELIEFTDQNEEKYILITLSIGKIDSSENFISIDKLDPDKIGDFKIQVEYRFQKQMQKV